MRKIWEAWQYFLITQLVTWTQKLKCRKQIHRRLISKVKFKYWRLIDFKGEIQVMSLYCKFSCWNSTLQTGQFVQLLQGRIENCPQNLQFGNVSFLSRGTINQPHPSWKLRTDSCSISTWRMGQGDMYIVTAHRSFLVSWKQGFFFTVSDITSGKMTWKYLQGLYTVPFSRERGNGRRLCIGKSGWHVGVALGERWRTEQLPHPKLERTQLTYADHLKNLKMNLTNKPQISQYKHGEKYE